MAFEITNISANPKEYDLHDLQLYKCHPMEDFVLEDLKSMCIERIDVLLLVERIYNKIGMAGTVRQFKEMLLKELNQNNCDSFFNIINGPSKLEIKEKITSLRKLDNVSHFMLRNFCPLQDIKWFHIQELRLFYWRIYTSTIEEIKTFFTVNMFQTYPISDQEKNELKKFIKGNNLSENMQFYKVPFQLVLDLVEREKVFLKSGMAFVPEKELAGLCFCYFKENLASGLKSIHSNATDDPNDLEDTTRDFRLDQIFDVLKEYIDVQRRHGVESSGGPSVTELDDLLPLAYPLCMRLIHEHLRKYHHLKHGARVQYILFLKTIGLSLQDALVLWKEEFTKVKDMKTFQTDYEYRLKYFYGATRSKKAYSCNKCDVIFNFDVKPGEGYGCPFKTLSNTLLRKKLNEYNLELPDIEDIITFSSAQNYQRACLKYCQAANYHIKNEPFQSPAEYFDYIYANM